MSQARKDPRGGRNDTTRTGRGAEPSVVLLRDSDALDSTMPPTPLRDLLAADGASVFVLSDDHALLGIVQEAGGEQYPVFAAKSWQGLREAIVERRCGIALLDIDALTGEVEDRASELAQLNPALVVLVASARDKADGLLNLLSHRRIHRLLIKPPTVGITRLLLESSVNRYIELKQRTDSRASGPASPPARLAGWRSWLLAGVLVVGTIVGVAFATLTNRGDEPMPSAAVEVAAAPVVAPVPLVPVATRRAPQAAPVARVAEGSEFVADPGASIGAVVPERTPADATVGLSAEDDAGAATGLAAVVPQGPDSADLEERYAAVEVALLDDDLDGAESLLAELAADDPESTRAAFLSSQLARARAVEAEVAEAQAAAALAAEAAVAPSEMSSLIGLARARLAQGQVLVPAGDSAVDYYERARAIDAAAPGLDALRAELGAAVLTAAEVALAGNGFSNAESLFVRARELGVADADVAGLELSLALARESLAREAEDALLTTVTSRLSQGMVFEPESESALAAALELRERNPDHPGLSSVLQAIRAELERMTTAALDAGDWARADTLIGALERAAAPFDVTAALREDLVFGERQAAYLAVAAPASELAVINLVAPEYPNRAITRNIEGWVDLEFVVDGAGLPRDIVVTGAEPAAIFDAAAVAAAEAYTFVPFERDGRVYERRVQLRIRFALQ